MFMQRKDSRVMVMTDITEELNAVDMTSFSHQLGLSHKSLQFCILESYRDKHTRVQFLNCGSHRQ